MTGPRRVLFVTHNAPRFAGDAAGSFVLRLATALQAQGTRVHIVAPGAAGLPPTTTLEGVAIDRVRYASDARMTLAYTGTMAETVRGSWGGKVALLQLLARMRRHVQRCLDAARQAGDPFELVHAHWWFPAGLALWRALGPEDPPLLVTMHGSDVRLATQKPAVHPVMRAVLGQAVVCTAVSSWLASEARAIAPSANITVAPMPVDTRRFSLEGAAPVRRGVLFVGRLNAQKGLRDLLEALALPALAGTSLRVLGDGPDRAALAAHAVALGISDRVVWVGTVSQDVLASYYASAQAVAVPSRGEGLGLVAVEAQLCGTPVIAYADGGLVDAVRPEHGGTLVPVGNVQALANSLARVIGSDETRQQLGQLARADMLARFSPEAVASTYQALYRQAGGNVRASALAAPPTAGGARGPSA